MKTLTLRARNKSDPWIPLGLALFAAIETCAQGYQTDQRDGAHDFDEWAYTADDRFDWSDA
ncbi:MAG TPA: hypothetical protein VKE42_10510 [Candidatus Cybelea sp.]|nr:hypothetical protein [Candidatus Cybelea sp.]